MLTSPATGIYSCGIFRGDSLVWDISEGNNGTILKGIGFSEVSGDMVKIVETLIFDFDGTLVDSRQDIINALNYTLRKLDYPPLPAEVVAGYVGGGAAALVQEALGVNSRELNERFLPVFLEIYAGHCTEYTTLYPNVREVLAYYQAKKLCIVTNKITPITMKILRHFGISSYFAAVLGPDLVKNSKPHPEPIEKVLQAVGAKKNTAVMIGDSPIDIEAGKNAGIMTCGAAYGLRPRHELAASGADIIIEQLTDLFCYYA